MANLYQKLLKITEEVGKIEKTGRNQSQNYAFVEHSKVVAEVRVQLAKHGVMIIPETVSREIREFTNTKGTNFFHAIVASKYTLINADNPEERITCDWAAGEALDTGDKASNKATTASHKYFLMKLFNISDQDDPDRESHDIRQTVTLADLSKALKDKGIDDEDDRKTIVKAMSAGAPLTGETLANLIGDIEAAAPDTLQNIAKVAQEE